MTNSIGMKLILIPPGTFTMGSPDSEKDRGSDEFQHQVEISKPFYLGVFPVTQEEYESVTGTNPSLYSPGGNGADKVQTVNTSRFPVETVSWHDAVAFCKELSELEEEVKAGRKYRLPTEAEWEYACRGGVDGKAFGVGDGTSLSSTQANFDGSAAKGPFLDRTTQVGSYRANAFGLYDMHGNVWEWCADWYDADYYKTSPRRDPENTTPSKLRVCRGGCRINDASYCRSAYRGSNEPGLRYVSVGFRVAAVQVGP